ncbi:iron chelate uptake ABC transporter family permease subunit [Enterococcus dispar]|uniref:iron chelate uptake ABC transporter family permease subunit n=1 Tax=Enterococcus dispar TaxID=44009 RepID=UPI0021D45D42|nr:iron chelate uptake ABC transporter family permease subunit [Enterococcus dispar]MCU7358103.1 iron chelate uptake ABC transporter family permease subunit [Enterococcus dispar]
MKNYRLKIFILCLFACLFLGLYLSYGTYGNWSFAFSLRGKKIAAFVLVAILIPVSTISFQTLTQNQFLTQGILGIDQLYVTLQTLLFFLIGGTTVLAEKSVALFLLNIILMAGLSVLFITFFLGKSGKDLFTLLMVGMIASSLFGSISTFLQVLMDPNEYDLLQGRLFASFSKVDSNHLVISTGLLFLIISFFWYFSPELDALRLGVDLAVNLGISVAWLQKILLFLIAAAIGVATALVGPTVFLGFVIATISYEIFPKANHRQLFIGASLIAIIFLVGGQFLLEQVFGLKTTISILIQFIGGLFFIIKLVIERKKT